MTADLDLDPDLEARLSRAGAHLDALAVRDAAAGSGDGAPGEAAYVRGVGSGHPPGRRLAVAAAVVLLVAAVAGGLYLARPDGGPPGVATDPTPAPTTTSPTTIGGSDLALRPVLDAAAKSGPCPTGQVAAADQSSCYSLGPAGVTSADIATAEASQSATGDGWEVAVTLRPGSRSSGNDLFNACYAGDSTCPPYGSGGRGAVAVVWRGVVVSAPNLNGPDLADDALALGGRTSTEGDGFSEADARALAAELRP